MYIPLLRTWYVHAHFDFPSGRGKLSSQKQVQKLSPSVHVPLRAIKIVHATHHKGLPDIPHAVHETDWVSDERQHLFRATATSAWKWPDTALCVQHPY